MIMPSTVRSEFVKKHLAQDAAEGRQTILISPQEYPLAASIAVSEERILLYTVHGDPFALYIKNRSIAQTLKSIHDMVWDRYQPNH